MNAGHNDPRLLYSIPNINAYHIQDGEESPLSASGPQTLSLLMVPTSSPFDDLSNAEAESAAPEEDFYLHLHLPPELDLSLPATTQIYHQPPRSYLIPRWDLGPEAGAFTRIEFPKVGSGPDRVTQEDVDTFETILAQCTAFLERAKAPSGVDMKGYNPQDYAPGEGYVDSGSKYHHGGHIVLIDEEDGSVVGELSHSFDIIEGNDVLPGSKRTSKPSHARYLADNRLGPVEFTLPQDGQGNQIVVNNISEDYLQLARHPAYKDSSIVQNAATASRLIVTGSGYLANAINSGALAFTQNTQPNRQPMKFSPSTQERVRKLNNLTNGAVSISAKTVGQVGRYAQNLGATMARRGEQKHRGAQRVDKDGRPIEGYQPGVLNKSIIAFSTITDGIEQSAKQLLTSGSTAASTVVRHRYGSEAGQVAGHLTGGIRNVGLVYVDVSGVSRKAVIKSVAKGMVVGSMPNGEQLMVGDGDGGTVPAEMFSPREKGKVPHEPDADSSRHGEGRLGYSAAPAYSGDTDDGLAEDYYARDKR
jgi:spartin